MYTMMQTTENRENVVLSSHGQKIFGIIHRPINAETYPAVLICHGLGGNKVGHRRLYVKFAHRLALAGIAALRIDFRGCGDSEGRFSDMTIESEVADAIQGLEFLNQDQKIDPKRIGIFGRSFGGAIAVLAASKHENIQSMALWAPVFNGDQWRESWEKLQRAEMSFKRSQELMSINGMQPGIKFFQQLFALNLTDALKKLEQKPLLHIHGEKDNLVNTTHAQEFEKIRNLSKSKSKFMLFPNSDHDFTDNYERSIAMSESLKWFKKTLKGDF